MPPDELARYFSRGDTMTQPLAPRTQPVILAWAVLTGLLLASLSPWLVIAASATFATICVCYLFVGRFRGRLDSLFGFDATRRVGNTLQVGGFLLCSLVLLVLAGVAIATKTTKTPLDTADALHAKGKRAPAVELYKAWYHQAPPAAKGEIVKRIAEYETEKDNASEAARWMQIAVDEKLSVPFENEDAKKQFAKLTKEWEQKLAQRAQEEVRVKAEQEQRVAALAETRAAKSRQDQAAAEEAKREKAQAERDQEAKRRQAAKEGDTEGQVQAVPYRVVLEWTVPNGGHVRAIVIDPMHRNEKDMRTLGDELRQDTNKDRNAFISVFDDEKAARMRKRAAELSKADETYYDRHFIANYTRNPNVHEFFIFLNGPEGSQIEIKY